MLEHNTLEIEKLFKEHKDIETNFESRRAQQEEEFARELEKVRNDDANAQAQSKIDLEKEMQILEKCMEDMKAVYKLNEEKLNFNHRVLQEKIRVNENTLKSNKDKERKARENKRAVIIRYNKEQKKAQKANKDLTIQYKKLTKQFTDLQTKFENFCKADEVRIKEVFEMNQLEA